MQPDFCRRAVEGIDYVFMLSANTSGAAVMANTPLVHVTPNVVINTYMMEAAYQASVKKYFFVSSSAAYPEGDDHPFTEEEMFLGDPPAVYYPVGWMKRFSEILCTMYATRIKGPMATVVVRPSNVYGPYDKFDFDRSHVTAALLRRVVERHDPLEVWGTGDDERDLIFIEDFVAGALSAFEKTETHDVYNIASGTLFSVKEVLKTLLQVDGYQYAKVIFNSDKPSTIKRRSVAIEKAARMLGFTATTPLHEGLKKTISWFRTSRYFERSS
jgi:GDP-L-fucose synthase